MRRSCLLPRLSALSLLGIATASALALPGSTAGAQSRQGAATRAPGSLTPSIAYELTLTAPLVRQIPVTIVLEGTPQPWFELVLPAWTKRYVLRGTARMITELTAEGPDGEAVRVERRDPDRWRIHAGDRDQVTVRYHFLAAETSSAGARFDFRHAAILPGAILPYVEGVRDHPVTIRLKASTAWKVATTLDPSFDPSLYRASTYDELAWSPIELSGHRERYFAVGGMNVQLVLDRPPTGFDVRGYEQGIERLARVAVELFDTVPARDYLLVAHFPDAPVREGAGLPGAALVEWGGWDAQEGITPVLEASLGAFLRSWMGGRVRPVAMIEAGPGGVFTSDALWFLEGAADYYAALLMVRAGITPAPAFTKRLGGEITRLQNTPARTVQSAADASAEVWFRSDPAYRSPDRSIDYRNKGFLLAAMLDLETRGGSAGRHSLDEMMAFCAVWYGRGGRGFTDSDELLSLLSALTRLDTRAFLESYVLGTEELPYRSLLGYAGWQLVPVAQDVAAPGFTCIASGEGEAIVATVEEQSTAFRAGLRAGDRLLSLNGSRNPATLHELIEHMAPGDRLTVKVGRAGAALDLVFPLGQKTRQAYRVEPLQTVSPEQEAIRSGLLAVRP